MRTAGSDHAGGFMLTNTSSASSEPTPEVPRGAVPDQKTSRAPQSPARVLDAFGSDLRAPIVVEFHGQRLIARRSLLGPRTSLLQPKRKLARLYGGEKGI